ncbi:MAG TPA: hypothetical protein VN610_08605 [Bryobacteraceae bacterium]|nr:hypothetical protein [Bryobacteraceae bacterium]
MKTGLLLVSLFAIAVPALCAGKYTGPRPPKPDLPYLLHADNLVPTEVTQAQQTSKKKSTSYAIPGESSPAKTPLMEPIFLFDSKDIPAQSLQLFRLDAKNGSRSVVMGRRDSSGPLHLSIKQLDGHLYRIEADEPLENGEYSLSPSDSNVAFCFQIY